MSPGITAQQLHFLSGLRGGGGTAGVLSHGPSLRSATATILWAWVRTREILGWLDCNRVPLPFIFPTPGTRSKKFLLKRLSETVKVKGFKSAVP